jgi:quinoprotein glucose dehydrogenase
MISPVLIDAADCAPPCADSESRPVSHPARAPLAIAALVWLACSRPVPVPTGGPIAGWPDYGGDAGGTRHSPLTQITPENVGALEVAWVHHSGDIEDGSHGMGMRSSYQVTPILVKDTLYICTPFNRVIALDAETGAERWSYDPHASREGAYNLNCRGVASWVDARAPEGVPCRTRIFTGTLDPAPTSERAAPSTCARASATRSRASTASPRRPR